jgi:hypothetical protein
LATNKKITALSELSEINLADDDVLAVVDVSAGTTHKVRKSTLASALAGVASISATSPLAVSASTGSVTVSTGTIPVSKGGTGATSLTDGGVLLGSGTGAVTAMGVLSDGQMIVGDGTTDPVAESGATLRTSIGLGSIATQASNSVSISGGSITGITDLVVADGGTGASSLTDGGVLLGSGTGAITAMAVLGDGEMIVGDGTTDPVAESGATLRTSIGVAIGSDVQAFDADTLKADTADNLTAGFSTTVHDAGTKSSGTYTPDQDDGNIQKAVNGGAHTLAPTVDDCAVIIQYTNNASAGTITTSGFTLVDGDDISTTNGDDFFFYLTKANGFSLLTVKALQ